MTGTITAGDVLGGLRDSRATELAEQASQLELAVRWADLHPAESIHDVARFGDTPVKIAGEGAPLVSEFSIAEFAAALGMPTESGKAFVGEALELRHRLPKLWHRVQALDLQAWRARRVARQTMHLSMEAAGFVDRHIAHVAHKVGPIVVERLVDEAVARFMPATAQAEREQAADTRHVRVDHRQVSFAGTSRVYAEVDLGDAIDLEDAVQLGADELKTLGCTDSNDIRRAKALGVLARRQLTLDLPVEVTPRETTLVVHLSASDPSVGRVENTGSLVTIEQVREWCANPFAKVTLKPVLDLDEHIHVTRYEVPDRLADLVDERDATCVFPWCTRRATHCDHDHVVPHAQGGTTCPCNLAPLCRRHHRLKTHHGSWVYTALEPGTFLWTSPHGYQFLRDHTGTHDVSGDRGSGASPPDG